MSGNTVFSCAQLLVGLLGQQPSTVCLQHTYRLLVRSKADSVPSTRQLLEAWAAVNDALFRHGGFLPYEVYEEFAKSYGEEVARLVVSFDNLFITGQEQQQQSGQPRVNMTPRTQLLKESVQLLLRAVEEDGGDGGKTLSQFIKWANESGVPGHPAQDYNDIDIITWWTGGARMSMVSPQLPMGDMAMMSMTGQQSPFLMANPMLLAQQQQQLQQQQQKQRGATPTSMTASQASLLLQQHQQRVLAQSLLMGRSPSPTAARSSSPTPSLSNTTISSTSQLSASPSRMTPSPRSMTSRPAAMDQAAPAASMPPCLPVGMPRAADGEEAAGMASGLAMLYELWLSRAQGLSESKVQLLLQSIKSSLAAVWAGGDSETYKVSKNQVPKLVQSLLESKGIRRGVPGLDESWDYFLRFLEVKTQPIISKDLKDLLMTQMSGKGASGKVTVALQLLPEVAMDYVKPLNTLKELKDYVDIHSSELQALVDLLHRGSGIYKSALQTLIDFCQAPAFVGTKLQAADAANNAMDVCREEGQ